LRSGQDNWHEVNGQLLNKKKESEVLATDRSIPGTYNGNSIDEKSIRCGAVVISTETGCQKQSPTAQNIEKSNEKVRSPDHFFL
jgi:hypothetical protein